MKAERKRYRVLCIADSFFGLRVLQDALQEAGYEVLLAFTPDHAVAASIHDEFDAVILDAELIRKEGAALGEALKLARPTVPLLLLDHREDANRADALPEGVDSAVAGRSPAAVLSALVALLGENTAAAANSE